MTKNTHERFPHYYPSNADAVDVFADYDVISEPLPTRESRVFTSEKSGDGVTYASHSHKLAGAKQWRDCVTRRDETNVVTVLTEHGGGREITTLQGCYNFDLQSAINDMPERARYSLLQAINAMAAQVKQDARSDAMRDALEAHAEKRIRRRTARGRTTFKIETRQEQEYRLGKTGKPVPQRITRTA